MMLGGTVFYCPMINQEQIKILFDYNHKTGELIWRVNRGQNKVKGKVAGFIRKSDGYRSIYINNKEYLGHRLVFLWHNGYLPEPQIDHINRVRSDNRINNLRVVSAQCNVRNSGNRCDNIFGVKGVGWHKQNRKWQARVKVNNKDKYLGTYEDFDSAVCARLAAEQFLEWEGCDSSSPAYQYVKKNIIRCCLQG